MKSVAEDSVFDETFYLRGNADVAAAVAAGLYPCGFDHYVRFGRGEGRQGSPAAPAKIEPSDFDEQWYLAEYPDVAQGVACGDVASGYSHWLHSGKAEGRIPPPGYGEGGAFEAEWYAQVYHAARDDIAAGRASDPQDHFERLGRHRGYLPNRFAARPDDPAGVASRFGGLWLDQANAADLVAGRLELGRITRVQADLLQHWLAKGYLILRDALPTDLVDKAADALRRAYQGETRGLQFHCPHIAGYQPISWDAAVQDNPAKALDLHWLSQDIRDLIFADPVRECLELIFERRVLATQSLTFLRGSGQAYHQDTLYVPFTLPTQFAASWIALEDVQPGGGELSYFPGSHRLPEMLFGNRYKTLWDAQRMLRRNSLWNEIPDYSDRLERASRDAGLVADRFMAKKGDVLIWHADLAHGGLPISNSVTRGSVVTHYCPREVASLTFERGNTEVRSHRNVAWYATGYYAGQG